jgi:putative nucleotidyltransferase with HDIG domain
MSLEPTFEEQELLADAMSRERSHLNRREVISAIASGLGFCAACAALWAAGPPGSFDVLPAVLCAIVLVAATRVSFDTPFGFTVLTQVAFVPLLFALPAALVPLIVAAALAVAKLPGLIRGELPISRLLGAPGNAWFAIGPSAVFVLAVTPAAHAGAGLLVVALLAEFIVDFAVSTVRFAYSSGAGLVQQLKESWVYAIDAALSGVGLVVAAAERQHPGAVLALLPLLGLFAVLARERRQRLESLVELNNAYRGTALVLGDVVEADDGYTGEHCRGVVALALAVADRLRLDATRRRNLEFAALLHDVGKIAVPKEIINKPGKLTPEEWTIIKTHTQEGQRMLSRVGGFMRDVGEVVRSHHERWDGGGYPDGLAGETIPLEARIVAACDTWNAMRTDRAYRRALSYEVALAELRASSGTQLDPAIVEVLEKVVQDERGTASAGVEAAAQHSQLLSGRAVTGAGA